MQVNSYFMNSFLFHLINTGAKGSQALRTLKEDKTDGETQPGGPSKENEERKTTGGESGHFDRKTQTRGNTEPGILSFFCLFVCLFLSFSLFAYVLSLYLCLPDATFLPLDVKLFILPPSYRYM